MNTQVRVNSLLLACIFVLSSCGIVQGERVENMDSMARHGYLDAMEDERLCRALFNPVVKEQTLRQMKAILRARGVEKCQSGNKVVRLEAEKTKEPTPSLVEYSSKEENNKSRESPSDIGSISVEYWRSFLSKSSDVKDASSLAEKSISAARESTRLLREGKRMEGLALSIEAHALGQQAHVWTEHEGGERQSTLDQYTEALRKSREGLIYAGVRPEVLDTSIANLREALSDTPGFQSPPSSQAPSATAKNKTKELRVQPQSRSPTVTERAAMEAGVKKALFDPTSPLFGEAVIVNEKYGCLAVNAKNRFGGYTGEQWMLVAKSERNIWTSFARIGEQRHLCVQVAMDLD